MKKTTKRRAVALLLPLPMLAGGAAYVHWGRPSRNIETALTFPWVCFWYFGLRSVALAATIGMGYWYLLLAMAGHAVLCGRDRVSKTLFICVLATSAVVGGMMFLMRGFDPH